MMEVLNELLALASDWLSNPVNIYLLQMAISSLAQAFPKPRENAARGYVIAFNLVHGFAHNWALLNERAKGVSGQGANLAPSTVLDNETLRAMADAADGSARRANNDLAAALRELDRLRGIAVQHGVPPALVAPVKPAAPGGEPLDG